MRVQEEPARWTLDDVVAARKLIAAPRTKRPSVEHRHARTLPRATGATQHELSRIGLFATLPGEILHKLAQNMRREDVLPGAAVVNEGEDGDRFYIVLSGMLTVSQASRGPQGVLRPGDYFGEVALAMNIPRTASVRALTPATVASCDRATFDQFVRPLFADDA
jgi:CRP-like cAMP-binding protein